MSANHTPLPWVSQGMDNGPDDYGTVWIIGENLGGLVAAVLPQPADLAADDFDRVYANAAFIVTAVNAHQGLVKAGTDILALLEDYMVVTSLTANDRYASAVDNLRAALSSLNASEGGK